MVWHHVLTSSGRIEFGAVGQASCKLADSPQHTSVLSHICHKIAVFQTNDATDDATVHLWRNPFYYMDFKFFFQTLTGVFGFCAFFLQHWVSDVPRTKTSVLKTSNHHITHEKMNAMELITFSETLV